jgi:AcrR family transcriptional regulator
MCSSTLSKCNKGALKMKTRKANREEVRKNIIKISRRLFLEQGYENTTVRQVLKKAHLSTGSLYHFFKNKEEILLCSLKDALLEISSLTDSIAVKHNEPVLRYALGIAVGISEIFNYKRLFNFYNAIYKNESAENFMISLKVARMKNLLNDLNLHFTDNEIHSRILAIHGATRAIMLALINKQLSAQLNDIYSLIIRIALSEFNIPEKKINEIIKLTTKIIQTKTFSRSLAEKLKP